MTDRAHVEQLLMTEVLISQVNVQLQGENITLTENVCVKSRPIKATNVMFSITFFKICFTLLITDFIFFFTSLCFILDFT